MTAQINLLPWRERNNLRQKKTLIMISGLAVVIPVLVITLGFFSTSILLSKQMGLNQRLQNETALLDKHTARLKSLEQKAAHLAINIKFLTELHNHSMLTIHLLDEIIKLLPNGIFLTRIQQNTKDVNIKGIAQSDTEVALLMQKMAQNQWINEVELKEIKQTQEGHTFKFNLTLQLKALSNETI